MSVFKISQLLLVWQQLLGEARTRILLWYLLILGITFLVAIPVFRYQLYEGIDERVRQDMERNMMAFKALIKGEKFVTENRLTDDSEEILNESILSGEEQITTPASVEDLIKLFRAYLLYRRPEDESYFITFLNGEFYEPIPLIIYVLQSLSLLRTEIEKSRF